MNEKEIREEIKKLDSSIAGLEKKKRDLQAKLPRRVETRGDPVCRVE